MATTKSKIHQITRIMYLTAKALEKIGTGPFSVDLHLHGGTLVKEASQAPNLCLKSYNDTSWFSYQEKITKDSEFEFNIYLRHETPNQDHQ